MRSYLNDLTKNKESFHYSGTTSLPKELLAFYLGTNNRQIGPQLVITESLESAKAFNQHFKFWGKKSALILPPFDPSPFAGVQLSFFQVQERLSWLFKAFNENENHVFVAPILGLLQKTLPLETFFSNTFELSVGDQLPDNFFETLYQLGYLSSPIVEDRGHFANRGGIVDIYSPQMLHPVRIELFDDEIESLRTFDSQNQRTIDQIERLAVAPAREVILNHRNALKASQTFLKFKDPELQSLANHLRREEYCENLEYYLPLFYEKPSAPIDYFQKAPTVWMIDELNIETYRQKEFSVFENFYDPDRHPVSPNELFFDFLETKNKFEKLFSLEKINIIDSADDLQEKKIEIASQNIRAPKENKLNEKMNALSESLKKWPKNSLRIFTTKSESQYQRLKLFLENFDYQCELHDQIPDNWETFFLNDNRRSLHFFKAKIPESFALPSEDIVVYSLDHFLGKSVQKKSSRKATNRAKHLSFGELKEGDYIIHAVHGVCQFKGLIKMPVAGVEAEFLQLEFKDKDKLFLPIYRIHQIHKYSSEKIKPSLDKLGGSRFANIKTKTKKRLRELAHDLIKLYAQRSQSTREPYDLNTDDISDFFSAFPYQETEDQASAIDNVVQDLSSNKPMDRLICGDVGFGKTEVAMRAAFMAVANKKQVAVLAPTTVLTMQHFETFKKRFADWPVKIRVANRLKTSTQVKKTLEETKQGEVDILIGTHRLLSKDVDFKNLGLLVIDEEQKFGVKHKEKIRKLKINVDTVALSATPIPRTLNMSLLNIRDLSLINTAPVDRLEVRTFICRFNKEIIKRAIETELERGGQVFFLHNRVQSIYSVAEEIRQLLPSVPVGVGHGQLKEKELESVMMSFFNNDLKVLVASAIVESGVDIPNANTILINNADNFGLSQLYQLRGRVGRSGRRAYCYLLTEPNKKLTDIAKERLKVIQENTALGSGMQIAQYDLELRGAGTLLGEEQSGLIDNVGYEFYMELLDEAIKEAKGEKSVETVEPEINLKIKAFIPSTYISNIRLRLSYYRALTQIESPSDIDDLEDELTDQFGKPPEEVINLLGIMLIRYLCIQLGVKDISSGKESLVLSFTDNTPLPPSKVIELTSQTNKKYSITPDNRLKIRMKDLNWPRVHEEVELLLKFCP